MPWRTHIHPHRFVVPWPTSTARGQTRTSSLDRPRSSRATGCSAARCSAQSLVAGMRTVEEDRTVHSMHGYFLRPGDANQPITFSVERLRDGRSFSARRVHAYQEGQPILSMIASFQAEADGVEHQSSMPAGIPDPETLPSTAELLSEVRPPVGPAHVLRTAL